MNQIEKVTKQLNQVTTLNEVMNNNVKALNGAILEGKNGILYIYSFYTPNKTHTGQLKDFLRTHSNYILETYNRRAEADCEWLCLLFV